METILNYRNKLTSLKKELRTFQLTMKKILGDLKKNLSTEQHKKIKAIGNRPETLYRLEVHKVVTHVCPPFRPILLATGTPSDKPAKFLVHKLSSITLNGFTVKYYFAFAEEIVHQDSKRFM